MRIHINRNQLRAALCTAGSQDIRYYLNGVFVEATSGETRLVATNGHIASVQRKLVDNDTVNTVEVIIPRDKVELVKGSKGSDVVLSRSEEGKWSLLFDGDEYPFTPVDGTFPDYRRVIPTQTSGEAANYHPKYIAAFSKAAVILGNINGTIYLKQNGDKGGLPAFVGIADCPDFAGVIAPVEVFGKDKKEPDLPTWPRENLIESLV